VLAKLRYHSSP